jgi:hypothetical protein
MAITHTPMVITVIGVRVTGVMVDRLIMVIGRGVRVTGVMVDGVIMDLGVRVMAEGVIMVLGVRVTGVMVGIADNTFWVNCII